jgi:hypothetical protein
MRTLILILLVFMARPSLAYLPAAPELMDRMHTSQWRRANPVEIRVQLVDSQGATREERAINYPQLGEAPATVEKDLSSFYFYSYPRLSTETETLSAHFPSLFRNDASVKLTRLDRTICYLIEGQGIRLWLRKDDYLPLRLSRLGEDGSWISASYLQPINVSGRLVYPSVTEIRHGDDLIFLEKLVRPVDETSR